MKVLKIKVDVENNKVEFSNSDLTNTLDEAGLSHTDITDEDEIKDYFEERYGDEYEVIVEVV